MVLTKVFWVFELKVTGGLILGEKKFLNMQ